MSTPITYEIDDPCETDQLAVIARVREIFAAAQAKEFERLAGYHLYGPKFTKFDDFEPLERQDAAGARQSEEDGLGAVTDFHYDLEDLKVDVFGTTAVTTFVLDYGFAVDDETIDARARATLVLVNDDGGWRIVHEHFSAFQSNP